jgi:sigma-B regulation protein RsbU (phosphoserine phosphatase)
LNADSFPIFQGMHNPHAVLAALPTASMMRLADGEMLLEANADNHHLYILLSGSLEVRLKRDALACAFVKPGESVGEMSLIDGNLTSAFVLSVGESEVLALHESDFWGSFSTHPTVMRNITRQMIRRLRLASEQMVRNLEQALRVEHLEKELATARDIQMGALSHQIPLLPHHPQVDVFAYLAPASEVGGDLYEALPLDDGHILLAVGDVAGKGMPAALFMMRTLTLLRAHGHSQKRIEKLMTTLNQSLCENNESSMFVTLSLAIVSVNDGRLTLFNGGHPPPLLSRQGGPFELVGGTKGALLGVAPHVRYQSVDLVLAPGDRIVFYSDGVTEAENPELTMFSTERARTALDCCPSDGDMQELVSALTRAVADFSAGARQSDDITLLALRYMGPSGVR